MRQASTLLTALSLAGFALVLTACDTQAFCFANCGGGGDSPSGGNGGEGGDNPFPVGGSGQFMTGGGGEGAGGPCTQTNGGLEICDQVDNDCNGTVDDIAGIDYTDPTTCGTCDNNCFTSLLNFDPATITCAPSAMPGEVPGLCDGECADSYFELDGDPTTCEFCNQIHPTLDVVCDAKDDDCDGDIDEDVDLCGDENNCGKCGSICNVGHGTGTCVHLDMNPVCDEVNTECQISACDDDDADGTPDWVDLDGSYATGCEYQCEPTGVEVCGDQIDNDCDGLIDAADDLSMDPAINVPCFGDPDGICATVLHQGFTQCINGQVTCTGPMVLEEDDVLEVCNSADDDCDGQVDDTPSDAGGSCGVSNIFPCTFGTEQCLSGTLTCVGAINPGTETCNGQDDNCDGAIDLTGATPPADAVGTCNVPLPPPVGATSPCMAGNKACVGGTVQCIGSVGPTGPTDGCNVDANCDGVLTNQPNLLTDTANCGSCGNNCNLGAVFSFSACVGGTCQPPTCLPGHYDLDGNGTCEYACTFLSAQEACNAVDDDCDGQVDEMVLAPSPKQVCGVSPAASAAECNAQVAVTCVSGAWQCDFPTGVCAPGVCSGAACCASTPEVCDGLDNDCDGLLNENVPDFGDPCASDDGLPVSHGECRTTGTKVCNGPSATVCSAVQANCSTLPGGCTELCDGKDNDCDGVADEPFSAKGTNASFFYQPDVIKVGAANLWIYQYEASRPNAGLATPGSGNGYWSAGPPGVTFDETPSCSEADRLPWFNVTPEEVLQTCQAMGGNVCTETQWRDACLVQPAPGANCTWGYSPAAPGCTTGFTAGTKFCNLGLSFDFDTMVAGDQDGLLPTASPLLQNCFSPWEGLSGNPSGVGGRLFDLTGNLREITRTTTSSSTYTIMGGAFNSEAESGAACNFTFYKVDDEFKFYDTGFRCCFSSDPRL